MAINDDLFDAANRHQIFLIRFGGGTVKDVNKLLDLANKDAEQLLLKRIERLGPTAVQAVGGGRVTSLRLEKLIKDLKAQNNDLMVAAASTVRSDLKGLAKMEVDIADRRLNEAVGVDLNNLRPSPEVLNSLVSKGSLRGKTLGQWFKKLSDSRFSALEATVKLGLVEGDTNAALVRRFRATTGATKRQAEALVRTSVNQVGNQARELLYKANTDIIKSLRWTSTLDGRTSAICQARDGQTYPVGEGPRPPAHPNCRSLMTPVVKSWDELAPPGRLKPSRGSTGMDAMFDKQLKARGFSTDKIATIKRNTRSSLNGQVPDDLSYQDWLHRQPVGFQNEVLGKTRGKLFRKGGLPLNKFVEEPSGRSFTLAELSVKEEEAFMKIGKGSALIPMTQGTASSDFIEQMTAVVAKLPFAVQKEIVDDGYKISAGEFLTDIRPDLKGVHPRGYGPGATWDWAEGLHQENQRQVAIAQKVRSYGRVMESSRAPGVLRHELGHAYDVSGNVVKSSRSEFREAYESDLKALRRVKGEVKEFGYYTQKGAAGREEAFAEIFGQLLGGGADLRDVTIAFPATTAQMKRVLDIK